MTEAREERRKTNSAFPHDSPYNTIPFGIGARMCLGARLAEAELTNLLAAIVQKYRIKLSKDSEVDINKINLGIRRPMDNPRFIFEKRN